MTEFGEALRRYRASRSLTQDELAQRAGLTRKAVSALERGERNRPYPHTVQALADALALDDGERAAFVALVTDRASHPIGGRSVTGRSTASGLPAPPAFPNRAAVLDPAGASIIGSAFIGRAAEVDKVTELFRGPRRRQVVTLTGPGGVGKTTIALAAAARLTDAFSSGVVVVELGGIDKVDRVIPEIARVVGMPGGEASVRTVLPFMQGRQLLIVLDNVEHLVDVAPQLSQLVTGCPELSVLATSRAPLRIRSEQEVRVAPLAHEDTTRLFHERMRLAGAPLDADPGRETAAAVARLCEHTEGLPLAIELAAAAAAVVGPTALVARLASPPLVSHRDLPTRQRSMAATFDWSFDLLSADARTLLARLSVCTGAMTATLLLSVGGDDLPDGLAALAELLEHSMIVRAGAVAGVDQFRLLEPIAQHAAAHLDTEERSAARCRLAGAVLDLTSGLAEELRSSGFTPAVRLLEAGKGNLRTVVDVLFEEDRTDELAELMWSVWEYLTHCGHGSEGIEWAKRLQDRPMADQARARWLVAWGALVYTAGGSREARELLGDALALARGTGDDALAVEAAVLAAAAAIAEHDLTSATELIRDAEAHGTRADVPLWRTYSRAIAGEIAMMRGDLDGAEEALRDAEAQARRIHNPTATATVLLFRSVASGLRDRNTDAAVLAAEATEMAAAIMARWTLSFAVPTLTRIAVRIGDHHTAAWLLGASSLYAEEMALGNATPLVRQDDDDDRGLIVQRLGRPAYEDAWSSGRRATPGDIVAAARAIVRHCSP